MNSPETHAVIVGGGFAGVACAKQLQDQEGVRATLLDKNGFHQFQPLLYQVATAELTPTDIAFDLDEMFLDFENVEIRVADVVAVDPADRSVTTARGDRIKGDILVLAAGSQPNYFHTPGAAEFAFPLYSLQDAQRVRSRLLQIFEDVAERPELIDAGALNVVVVGAGPTGVEISGAIAELVHDIMPHRYHDMDLSPAQVIIVDLASDPLSVFSDAAHQYATKQLEHRGVKLVLNASCKEVTRDHVVLSDGTVIKTHLTVWGGGEMAAPVIAESGLPIGHGGRVDVERDLSVRGFPGVYAVGDAANIPAEDGTILPQLGSVAQQAGALVGRNIMAEINNEKLEPFEYHDKGIMAMIGRRAAVAEIGEHRHELHGRVAFAAWLGVHAMLLSNMGVELKAFMEWAEEFYVRPHHRSAELLNPSNIDTPRIRWHPDQAGKNVKTKPAERTDRPAPAPAAKPASGAQAT